MYFGLAHYFEQLLNLGILSTWKTFIPYILIGLHWEWAARQAGKCLSLAKKDFILGKASNFSIQFLEAIELNTIVELHSWRQFNYKTKIGLCRGDFGHMKALMYSRLKQEIFQKDSAKVISCKILFFEKKSEVFVIIDVNDLFD